MIQMIEIKNVSMGFEDSKKGSGTVALNEVRLTVPEGCIFGFLGSNGAGKSTLMRLMSGIYRPWSGDILIDGEPVFDNPAAKEKLFFVNDETTQFSGYTPEDLKFFYKGAYAGFSDTVFEHIMKSLSLPLDKRLSTFSKGMKRQTVVALALAAQTKYLFFDEAFDGLDPAMRRIVKNLITDEIIERGATLVVSSHNITEISELCDRAMLLHKGELIFSDELDNLRTGFTKVQLVIRDSSLSDEGLKQQIAALGLELMQLSALGSVRQLIIRAGEKETLEKLSQLPTSMIETIPLTLEEIFIYELEVRGYGSTDFITED